MKNSHSNYLVHNRKLLIFTLLVIFVILGISAHSFAFFSLDLRFSQYLQGFKNTFFSALMIFVSSIGDGLYLELLVGTSILFLVHTGYRLDAFKLAVSSLVAVLLGSVTKRMIGRPRPDSDLVTIQELLKDKSFPSLHVLLYTVIFGYLLYFALSHFKTKWLKLVVIFSCTVLILTIGLSRIYLGAHWASDTIGGYILGTLILLITIRQAKNSTKNAKR